MFGITRAWFNFLSAPSFNEGGPNVHARFGVCSGNLQPEPHEVCLKLRLFSVPVSSGIFIW